LFVVADKTGQSKKPEQEGKGNISQQPVVTILPFFKNKNPVFQQMVKIEIIKIQLGPQQAKAQGDHGAQYDFIVPQKHAAI
jgi:hypothetical protein